MVGRYFVVNGMSQCAVGEVIRRIASRDENMLRRISVSHREQDAVAACCGQTKECWTTAGIAIGLVTTLHEHMQPMMSRKRKDQARTGELMQKQFADG